MRVSNRIIPPSEIRQTAPCRAIRGNSIVVRVKLDGGLRSHHPPFRLMPEHQVARIQKCVLRQGPCVPLCALSIEMRHHYKRYKTARPYWRGWRNNYFRHNTAWISNSMKPHPLCLHEDTGKLEPVIGFFEPQQFDEDSDRILPITHYCWSAISLQAVAMMSPRQSRPNASAFTPLQPHCRTFNTTRTNISNNNVIMFISYYIWCITYYYECISLWYRYS